MTESISSGVCFCYFLFCKTAIIRLFSGNPYFLFGKKRALSTCISTLSFSGILSTYKTGFDNTFVSLGLLYATICNVRVLIRS